VRPRSRFLSDLAVRGQVAASTQNQALPELLFQRGGWSGENRAFEGAVGPCAIPAVWRRCGRMRKAAFDRATAPPLEFRCFTSQKNYIRGQSCTQSS
jgi:hypothetical protein